MQLILFKETSMVMDNMALLNLVDLMLCHVIGNSCHGTKKLFERI